MKEQHRRLRALERRRNICVGPIEAGNLRFLDVGRGELLDRKCRPPRWANTARMSSGTARLGRREWLEGHHRRDARDRAPRRAAPPTRRTKRRAGPRATHPSRGVPDHRAPATHRAPRRRQRKCGCPSTRRDRAGRTTTQRNRPAPVSRPRASRNSGSAEYPCSSTTVPREAAWTAHPFARRRQRRLKCQDVRVLAWRVIHLQVVGEAIVAGLDGGHRDLRARRSRPRTVQVCREGLGRALEDVPSPRTAA